MLNIGNDEGCDIHDAKRLLNSCPSDLTNLFRNIIRKSDEDLDECVLLFQWVLYSRRRLTAKELYVAIHYSRGVEPAHPQAPPDDNRVHRFLLHRSRGLVDTKADGVLGSQFIHETVRTFLLGEFGLRAVQPGLRYNILGTSHEVLRNACMQFLRHNALAYKTSQGICPQIVFADDRAPFSGDEYVLDNPEMLDERTLSGLPAFRIVKYCDHNFWPGFKDLPRIVDGAPFERYAIANLIFHCNTAEEAGLAQHGFLMDMQKDVALSFLQWACTPYIRMRHTLAISGVQPTSTSSTFIGYNHLAGDSASIEPSHRNKSSEPAHSNEPSSDTDGSSEAQKTEESNDGWVSSEKLRLYSRSHSTPYLRWSGLRAEETWPAMLEREAAPVYSKPGLADDTEVESLDLPDSQIFYPQDYDSDDQLYDHDMESNPFDLLDLRIDSAHDDATFQYKLSQFEDVSVRDIERQRMIIPGDLLSDNILPASNRTTVPHGITEKARHRLQRSGSLSLSSAFPRLEDDFDWREDGSHQGTVTLPARFGGRDDISM